MRYFNFIALLFILIPTKALALIEVDITRGNLNPLPIAVSPLSIDKGETATGSGFKLPLVISTSINPNDFIGKDKIIINDIRKFFIILFIFNLPTFLLRQNLIVTLSIFHIQYLELLNADII